MRAPVRDFIANCTTLHNNLVAAAQADREIVNVPPPLPLCVLQLIIFDVLVKMFPQVLCTYLSLLRIFIFCGLSLMSDFTFLVVDIFVIYRTFASARG